MTAALLLAAEQAEAWSPVSQIMRIVVIVAVVLVGLTIIGGGGGGHVNHCPCWRCRRRRGQW